MRRSAYGIAISASLLLGAGVWTGLSAAPGPSRLAQDKAAAAVDVELVLAVDVSFSMDMEELAVQREGYAQALTSREFLQALKEGANGRIAITYFEWASSVDQKVIVPWRVIDGPETADSVAADIMRAPLRRASRTSISGALNFGAALFDSSGYRGVRRVIDVSGDGPNNNGGPVTIARDETLAKGIIINGLPIILERPFTTSFDIQGLDAYYEDCVIGGPGSFMIAIRARDKFKEAIRTKLVLEIAGREPERRVVPVAAAQPRVSCLVGERMWQNRWGVDR